MLSIADEHDLFSYGTLQNEAVQLATFGRLLCGSKDVLAGYALSMVAIEDPQVVAASGATHHPIIKRTGLPSDTVDGTVFKITRQELLDADSYEVADYERIAVTLASGIRAWVYVDARHVSRDQRSRPSAPTTTITASASGIRYVSPQAVPQARLLEVARRIFSDTFSHLYEEDAFRDFCDRTWAEDGPMANDLADPSVHWRIAALNDEPVGYAKVTPLRAPARNPRAGALELQQIYVLGRWQGKGVAEELMGWAVASARAQGAPELYLTVFDHNERAKRFYARHGFEEVGRCTFKLGNRLDDDRIWRKVL